MSEVRSDEGSREGEVKSKKNYGGQETPEISALSGTGYCNVTRSVSPSSSRHNMICLDRPASCIQYHQTMAVQLCHVEALYRGLTVASPRLEPLSCAFLSPCLLLHAGCFVSHRHYVSMYHQSMQTTPTADLVLLGPVGYMRP